MLLKRWKSVGLYIRVEVWLMRLMSAACFMFLTVMIVAAIANLFFLLSAKAARSVALFAYVQNAKQRARYSRSIQRSHSHKVNADQNQSGQDMGAFTHE
ncbi:hypothetical protein A9Q81_11810 [Gammaproteobacteria bacterium 42_54_T18]|nr:hypothetical protein A9Q81_11810 [Gammaproteobacteria bacterium 42_54_T18]